MQKEQRAWVTLLTQSSYLPGVLALADTLHIHNTKYPLMVMTTPSLSVDSLDALKREATHNPIIRVLSIDPLNPPNEDFVMEIPRFRDTWTKLRVFELTSYGTVVFIDADTLVLANPDAVFDTSLPGSDWVAAIHDCRCTLDKTTQGCPYTSLRHPAALESTVAVPHSQDKTAEYAQTRFNSGVFVFQPSAKLRDRVMEAFTKANHAAYKFTDQAFLFDFFRDRWTPLTWQYNALKPFRPWHGNVWRDNEVKIIHFVMDKPWSKRVSSDGIAGLAGRDGWTHSQWWIVCEAWREKRAEDKQLVAVIDGLIAEALTEETNAQQVRENREKGFPLNIPDIPHIDACNGTSTQRKEEFLSNLSSWSGGQQFHNMQKLDMARRERIAT